MTAAKAHNWTFRSRFRANAFGWRSDLPIKRIKEAVAEIKKATRKDKILGAEGAVLFLEKVSGALEHVDGSSGAIGTAINRAIEALVPIVAQAPASDTQRDKWPERLWCAVEDDAMPYIELLPDHWGELCVTPERASRWADRFIEGVRMSWHPDLPRGGYFKGTPACLSALYAARRHEDLLNLLDPAGPRIARRRCRLLEWCDRCRTHKRRPVRAIGGVVRCSRGDGLFRRSQQRVDDRIFS